MMIKLCACHLWLRRRIGLGLCTCMADRQRMRRSGRGWCRSINKTNDNDCSDRFRIRPGKMIDFITWKIFGWSFECTRYTEAMKCNGSLDLSLPLSGSWSWSNSTIIRNMKLLMTLPWIYGISMVSGQSFWSLIDGQVCYYIHWRLSRILWLLLLLQFYYDCFSFPFLLLFTTIGSSPLVILIGPCSVGPGDIKR